MQVNFLETVLLCHLQQGQRVIDRTVGTLRSKQANQVQAAAICFNHLDGIQENFVGEEAAVLHRPVQADVVLQDDPPCADVHVPGLGVAGLPGLQADRLTRRFQPAVRKLVQQFIPNWRGCQVDRVGLVRAAKAPAVQDQEQHPALSTPIVSRSEVLSIHRFRFRQVQGGEYRRSQVGQFPLPQCNRRRPGGIDQDEWHRVGRVRDVGGPFRGNQRFQVAVIRSDQGHVSGNSRRTHHLSQVMVNTGCTAQFGLVVGGVANDIPVGKVGHDQVETLVDSPDHCVCHLGQAQLGYLVEGHAFR